MATPAALASKTKPWPPGVIMRALTAGAHIDIVANSDRGSITAICRGCGEEDTATGRGHDSSSRRDNALYQAKTWTRKHADCPFLLNPVSAP